MTRMMQKYNNITFEYAQFVPSTNNFLEWLNELGAEGWGLCAEIQGKYYFGRLVSIGVNVEWIEPK